MGLKVEDLTAEQREKLAELSLITGIEDHQELLDRIPEIAESLVEAFKPVARAIIHMGERMVEEWNGLPPETLAAIEEHMDGHEIRRGERGE